MSDVASPERPGPILTDDNHLFWEAARAGKLVTQKCGDCGRLRHPPRPMCPACHSLVFEMIELAGAGVVYSYSFLHHPQSPAFTYPVIAALVDLDEGVRIVSNLVDVELSDVRIDMPVEVRFVLTKNDGAVPVFAPRKSEQ
jgi:uncharacterized OB-fold protein